MEVLSVDQKNILIQGLGSDWELLAGYLNFSKAETDGFKHDGGRRLKMQIKEMLDDWCSRVHKEKDLDPVKVHLLPALSDMGRKDLVMDLEMKAKSQTAGVKWISNIKQPVRYFQARTAAETSITRHLEKYNIALVCGMHGSGKSQLALAYWTKHRDQSLSAVNWSIPARSPALMEQGLIELANELGIQCNKQERDNKSLFTRILKHLHLQVKDCTHFLIFDDASEKCCSIVDECMKDADAKNVRVIVTSLYKCMPYFVCLAGLSEDEVVDFFNEDEYFRNNIKKSDISSFASVSSCLPLAMVSARAYISKRKIDFTKYRKRLSSTNEKVKKEVWHNKRDLSEYDESLLGALLMNVDEVKQQFQEDQNGHLFSAFQTMAFLGSEDVPLFLLMGMLDEEDEEVKEINADIFVNHIETMCLGTVSCLETDSIDRDMRFITVHDAIRQALVLSFSEKEKIEKFKEVLSKMVGLTCDKDDRHLKEYITGIFLVGHLNCLAVHCKEFCKQGGDVELQLLRVHVLDFLGFYYCNELHSSESDKYFQDALQCICGIVGIDFNSLFVHDCQTIYETLTSDKAVGNIPLKYLERFRADRFYKEAYLKVWDESVTGVTEKHEIHEGYISSEVMEHLQHEGVFLEQEIFSKIYLVELMASVLYGFSRSFFLHKRTDSNINIKETIYKCAVLADYLCKAVQSSFGISVFHGLVIVRSVLLFFKSDRCDVECIAKSDVKYMNDLEEAVKGYENILQNDTSYYQFGVLKCLPTDSFNYLFCCCFILDCFSKHLAISKDPVIFSKGLQTIELAKQKLGECGKLNGPNEVVFYTYAASFLVLSDKCNDKCQAVTFLKTALQINKETLEKRQKIGNLVRWFRTLENLVNIFMENTNNCGLDRSYLEEEIKTYIDTEIQESCRLRAQDMLRNLQISDGE